MNAPFTTPYDVEAIRAEFPILSQQVYGKPLVYLDNAASAQKPRAVIDAMVRPWRRATPTSIAASTTWRTPRPKGSRGPARRARAFLNAGSADEIVFTKSATEAYNLVADSLRRMAIGEGDEIILSIMEHHSNIVPWHFLRERKGAVIKWAPGGRRGQLPRRGVREALLAAHEDGRHHPHVERARHRDADEGDHPHRPCAWRAGAAWTGRRARCTSPSTCATSTPISTSSPATRCTARPGIGVLYGKREWLERMPPYQGGGEMIREVRRDGITYNEPPHRFEAGTPPIVEAIGLGAALALHDAARPREHPGPRGGALGLCPRAARAR